MEIEVTNLKEILLIKPKVFGDPRGYFFETWQLKRYEEAGLPSQFVQDNISTSTKGVLRGLHFQNPNSQGKLITAFAGEIMDVAVDIRQGSATFGQWTSAVLSDKNHHQFWVPKGFAHGFCVLSPTAMVSYKCTDLYHPQNEFTLNWNDPQIKIEWPTNIKMLLSDKDIKMGKNLQDFTDKELPRL